MFIFLEEENMSRIMEIKNRIMELINSNVKKTYEAKFKALENEV